MEFGKCNKSSTEDKQTIWKKTHTHGRSERKYLDLHDCCDVWDVTSAPIFLSISNIKTGILTSVWLWLDDAHMLLAMWPIIFSYDCAVGNARLFSAEVNILSSPTSINIWSLYTFAKIGPFSFSPSFFPLCICFFVSLKHTHTHTWRSLLERCIRICK